MNEKKLLGHEEVMIEITVRSAAQGHSKEMKNAMVMMAHDDGDGDDGEDGGGIEGDVVVMVTMMI